MDKLRVGIFSDAYYPQIDGVISVVDNYATCLVKLGCEVTVFAPASRKKGYVDDKPYTVIRSKTLKAPWLEYDLPLPKRDKALMNYIKTHDFDIVHIHSPASLGKLGLNYAKQHKVPSIITMHSQFKRDFLRQTKSHILSAILLKSIMKVFNGADHAWAVNKAVAEVFKGYGYKGEPTVVHNATNMLPVEDVENARKLINEKYNIDDDTEFFLYVGRINVVKNLKFLLNAIKLYREYGRKFKLVLIGSGQDYKKITKYAHKLNLDDVVEFTGSIYDKDLIAKHYARADLFCFPSLYDCSSIVQIEAASQHTPTLFLGEAVTASTVTDGVNGYFSDNSPEAFSKKLDDIMTDKVKLKEISDNAYNDLYITWDKLMVKVLDDYKNIIEDYKNKLTVDTVK